MPSLSGLSRFSPPGLARPSRASRRGGGLGPVTGPDSVEVTAKYLRIGDGYAATFAVTGYPAEVGAGWLEPLLCYPGRLDVALHIEPIPPATAAQQLRKQLGRLESTRRAGASKGRLEDPLIEAAAGDATDMAAALARGESRLFRVGLYLTVLAGSKPDLDAEVGQVRALAASMLLDAQPASFRSLQGWTTTLPMGVDSLRMRRTLDTPALAAAFPFTSPDLSTTDVSPHAAPTGILYGLNGSGSGLVIWDRWAEDNYNSVTLARSGAGKSYFTKLEVLRSLYDTRPGSPGVDAVQVWVIDPEDEYARLTRAVGGTHVRLGAPGVRVNPFDLPAGAQAIPDALTRRALFTHTLLAVLFGQSLTPEEHAALDRAVIATYTAAGITQDRRTWQRPAPLLADLAATLAADPDLAARSIAARLTPYTAGSYRGLFDGPTTHQPAGHLVTLSLRDLPDELRPVCTLLALDTVWRQVINPRVRRRRLIVVDEAWLLMAQPDGARFLHRMAKAARKHWAGLAFISQDAADVLSTDIGTAIVSNAATQVLLRQAPQAIEAISTAFRLSAGERSYLLTADRGTGLLVAGTNRVAFAAVASTVEHGVCTTDPAELTTHPPTKLAASEPVRGGWIPSDDDLEP